jgi:hypothetical protein
MEPFVKTEVVCTPHRVYRPDRQIPDEDTLIRENLAIGTEVSIPYRSTNWAIWTQPSVLHLRHGDLVSHSLLGEPVLETVNAPFQRWVPLAAIAMRGDIQDGINTKRITLWEKGCTLYRIQKGTEITFKLPDKDISKEGAIELCAKDPVILANYEKYCNRAKGQNKRRLPATIGRLLSESYSKIAGSVSKWALIRMTDKAMDVQSMATDAMSVTQSEQVRIDGADKQFPGMGEMLKLHGQKMKKRERGSRALAGIQGELDSFMPPPIAGGGGGSGDESEPAPKNVKRK